EGGHRLHLGGREPQHLGTHDDARLGDVALFGLHQVQHRQQRAACLRVPRGEIHHLGACLLGQCHQRSTPPITGSMLATAATTSATCPPSLIGGTACRLLKDGSRKCTR